MVQPLEKRHIKVETGGGKKRENVPALDPRWVEKIQFLSYQPPPLDQDDRGQFEEWVDRLKFIEEDLHWLLQLPHDKFWCQAIFDETLHNLIDSYLRFAPRSHDVLYEIPSDTREKHNEVHRLIFLVCLRMATYKESKDHHITPSVFGEIIYENYLFDIPKLLDLCVLYGQGNSQLLSKMIDNIFTQQPNYNDDLKCTVPTIIQVFNSIKEKCGITDSASMSPQKLTGPRRESSLLVTMAMSEFQDILFYLADTGMTLTLFLEVYSAASDVFFKQDFVQHVASLYDSVVPEVATALKKRVFTNESHKKMLQRKLSEIKQSLLKVIHLIFTNYCITPILENRSSEDRVEDFLQTFSALLNERRFLAAYESKHRFSEYLEILNQSTVLIDEMRIQYVQDAISHAFTTYGTRRKPTGGTNRGGRTSPDGSPAPLDDDGPVGGATCGAVGGVCVTDDGGYDAYEGGACAPRKAGVELESLICSVKDLLPDLGDGFVELCLEEMDYSIERVINAVLEDKLPPSLQDMDRMLPRENTPVFDKAPPDETKRTGSLLEGRRNVFDNDEFDVFSRDAVDTSRIFKGKQHKTDNTKLEIDKADMADMKSRMTEAYGYSVEEVDDPSQTTGLDYDDEYDDTYDVNIVGADDADSADELTNRRPFTTPRILGGGHDQPENRGGSNSQDSSASDEEKPSRDNFCEDPAVLRQRAEERYQAKAQRRGQGRRHGNTRPPTEGQAKPETKYDVKGKPKGQGQDENVVKNRLWKEKHKSSRGNHNRRYMSDKKRMGFP